VVFFVDRLSITVLVVIAGLISVADCAGQPMATRFGFGVGAVVNPSNPDVSDDDLGIDFRARLSQPISERVSFAVGLGTFMFSDAQQEAEFVLNPQVMLIATLDGVRRFPYIVAGVGAVLPVDQDRTGQLAIHAAYGWAWPFGSRASVFAEINPMLAFAKEKVALMVPVRLGLIF
jgi:hypothetical protein